jgi:hypothetical protein
MFRERENDGIVKEVAQVIGRIEECIEKAWYELRNEKERAIWWDEQGLILPFYFHLRPMIDEMNKQLETIQLFVVPEYSPKASFHAKVFGEKYPLRKKDGKEFVRTKKVDLCVVAFDPSDFERKKEDSKTTYWYINHAPVVLLEFKLLNKKELLPKMKDNLKKLAEIERNYEGVKKVYFCCLTNEKLLEEECQDKLDKTKIENLRICYGTGDGKDWGNYLFD